MDNVETLCERYGVDLAHARHVAALTLRLVDAAAGRRPVTPRLRALAETAALLHNIALNANPARHHTAGRDLIAAADLEGIDAAERAMIACAVRFHRKKVDAEAEPLMQSLTDAQRGETLTIAAALRVADGLDYEGTQTTRIDSVEVGADATTIRIRGPFSHEDGARALAKADLWAQLLPRLQVEARATRPGAGPDMPLREAARRILRHLAEVVAIPSSGAPAEVRAARVGLRRLRTGVRLFGRYADVRGLRELAAALDDVIDAGGPARETEALVAALDAYLESAGDAARTALGPMRQVWTMARDEARRVFGDRLERAGITDALARLTALDPRQDGGAAAAPGQPAFMRHVAPLMLERALARAGAYDTLTPAAPDDDWHRYRLAARRLRDTAGLLRDALPTKKIKAIREQCAQAQQTLGEIRDARLAAQAALRFASALPLQGDAARATLEASLAFAASLEARAAALQPFVATFSGRIR